MKTGFKKALALHHENRTRIGLNKYQEHSSFTLVRNKMKTFILIHGSWHSSWNWHRVSPILEKAGHKVLATDLPGMGMIKRRYRK